MRSEFPERVKVKRLNFAEFRCEGTVRLDDGKETRCNASLAGGRVEFDHDDPDGLTGKPTFENCRALCRLCHAEKTKADTTAIAKAKRREAGHLGARAAPVKPMKSAPFPISEKAAKRLAREPRQALPPRPLFR